MTKSWRRTAAADTHEEVEHGDHSLAHNLADALQQIEHAGLGYAGGDEVEKVRGPVGGCESLRDAGEALRHAADGAVPLFAGGGRRKEKARYTHCAVQLQLRGRYACACMKQLLQGVVAASARLLHLPVNKWEAVWWVCKGQPRFKSATPPPLPLLPPMLRGNTARWVFFGSFEHIFEPDSSSFIGIQSD